MPPKKQSKPPAITPTSRWSAPEGWGGIASIVDSADGLFAGSRAGQGAVCKWTADGTLAWRTDVAATHPELAIDIDVAPGVLWAYVRESRTGWMIDASTGAIRARHDVAQALDPWCRNVRMAPDGMRLVARLGTDAHVFELPGFTHTGAVEGYANENSIAFSVDGKRFAFNGHEVHVFEGSRRIATFEPADSPYQLAFTPDGRIVTGDGSASVEVFTADGTSLATIDTMPERKSRRAKKAVRALTASNDRIAVLRDDGEIVVCDYERELMRLSKLAPTAIAFATTGELLVGTSDVARYRV